MAVRTRPFTSVVAVVMAMAATVLYAPVQAQDEELIQIRHQLALNYLEPEPHMALAKHLLKRGDRLQAFYNLEYARRGRFPQAQFARAFSKAFGAASDDNRGMATFNKAVELQRAGNLKEAEDSFLKAAALSPGSVHIQSWVGRFLYKVRNDDERALPYYLNAYFLDPHAYESEFVESRIRRINYDAASIRYRWLIQKGTSLPAIVKDANPTVVVLALEAVEGTWSPELLETSLRCLDHDDEQVRWLAATAIAKNVDRSFDPTLKSLLQDKDLRKRGLGAYIAARVWKSESYPILRQMLREQAQLLRFDALSALAIDASVEARRLMHQHRRIESHPTLIQMIDKTPAP